MRKSLFFPFLLIICSYSTLVLAQDNSEAEKAASEAARVWVAQVDSAHYEKSWQTAAPLFQQSVTQEKWLEAARQVRGSVGALKTRTPKETRFTTSLPNAPAGEYVLVAYSSSFVNLPNGIENVVMMKTDDGLWKTVGYFVQPAQ